MDRLGIGGIQKKQSKYETDQKKLFHFLMYVLGIGGFGICLYAINNKAGFLTLYGVAMMISGASFGSGALLGFLFGIPISVQPEVLKNQQPSASSGENSLLTENKLEKMSSNNEYRGNTNLEDISNWLTKMLLGVGLTQSSTIVGTIKDYAGFAAPAFGGDDNSKFFATSILIYFLISGFMYGFIWTRLNLSRMFSNADNADEKTIAQQKTQISKLAGRYFNELFTKDIINKIMETGDAFSPLEPLSHEWITIAAAKNQIIAMYRQYKSGIVFAMGFDSILHTPSTEGYIITAIFDDILNGNNGKKRVLTSTGHGEVMTMYDKFSNNHLNALAGIIADSGYTIVDIIGSINTSKLSKGNILIVGNALGNFEDNEIKAVQDFVSEGGSLLVVAQPWAWKQYAFPDPDAGDNCFTKFAKDNPLKVERQDKDNILTHPMNKLVEPYEMIFLENAITKSELLEAEQIAS